MYALVHEFLSLKTNSVEHNEQTSKTDVPGNIILHFAGILDYLFY